MDEYFQVKLDQVLETLGLTEVPKSGTYPLKKFEGYAIKRETYIIWGRVRTDWLYVVQSPGDYVWLMAAKKGDGFVVFLTCSNQAKIIILGEVELPKNY